MMRMGDYCSRVPAVSGAGRGPRGGEGERGPEHLSSEGGVTVELRLAGRMGLLGTETAFEVLARAKALERQGRHTVHLGGGGGGGEAAGPAPAHAPRPRAPPAVPEGVFPPAGAKPIMFFAMLALVE